MRELRVQSRGRPLRIFYAFDPRRTAILLVGGDKTGDDQFYETFISVADRLYDAYVDELSRDRVDYMSGHHPFSELTKNFPPERQARVAEKVQLFKQEMALAELRKARQQSQADLAARLQVHQPAITKMEQRADMYVSNLRRFIEAMGGNARNRGAVS